MEGGRTALFSGPGAVLDRFDAAAKPPQYHHADNRVSPISMILEIPYRAPEQFEPLAHYHSLQNH
jgi:hypothetical protein